MDRKDSFNNEKTLQDKRRKNWFWDTNDVFCSDLSPFAKLVRLYLARCANSDRQAWPSYNKIARDCKISRDTAKRAVAELEEKGWIEKTVQKKEDGEHLSNIYFLCDPPEHGKAKPEQADSNGDGGGCSQHLSCHNLEGVGAVRTHLVADSVQVGADIASNNTNITIPSEQETYINTFIHSSIHNNDNNAHAHGEKTKPPVDNVDIVEKLAGRENVDQDSAPVAANMSRVKSLLKDAGFVGSQVEVNFLGRWVGVIPFEMIEHAVKKSVLNGKKSLLYVGGIFEDWLNKDICSLEQAEKETRYDSVLFKPPEKGIHEQKTKIKLFDSQAFRNYLNRCDS